MSSNTEFTNEAAMNGNKLSTPDVTQCESRDISPIDGSVPAVKKSGKKYDKGIDHVLKALSTLETPEEKLAALCKKYAEQLEEQRLSQQLVKQTQRKLAVVTREKEQLQSEHSKAILAKSKLEGLCRELQKHSKTVKDESMARARGEEEKRKEVSAKFQTTISEIQTQMEQNHERNAKLKEENAELADRLKKVIEQYELREQHVEKMLQHKDIERQLAEAKLKQSELQGKEQQEVWLHEKQLLLKNLAECHARMEEYEKNEVAMKAQITLYNHKFEEFQGTLSKSSEVFNTWKADMDTMTKRIKKLEKETRTWKSRWENTNCALIEMVDQKTKQDDQLRKFQMRCTQVEKLCRAMQAERKGEGKVEDQIESILAQTPAPAPTLSAAVTKALPPQQEERGRVRHRNKAPAQTDTGKQRVEDANEDTDHLQSCSNAVADELCSTAHEDPTVTEEAVEAAVREVVDDDTVVGVPAVASSTEAGSDSAGCDETAPASEPDTGHTRIAGVEGAASDGSNNENISAPADTEDPSLATDVSTNQASSSDDVEGHMSNVSASSPSAAEGELSSSHSPAPASESLQQDVADDKVDGSNEVDKA